MDRLRAMALVLLFSASFGCGAKETSGCAVDGACGDPTPEEFLADDGSCHTLSLEHSPCPATYAETQGLDRCGFSCAGMCEGKLVYQDSCTPSYGCAYEPGSGALVGALYGDDIPSFCDGQSYSLTFGDMPLGCPSEPSSCSP